MGRLAVCIGVLITLAAQAEPFQLPTANHWELTSHGLNLLELLTY